MAITGRSIPNVPILVRGSLADDPVATPQPTVVAAPRPRPGFVPALLMSTPLAGTDCLVHRPVTGTVARGATGTAIRPNTGIVVKPC